MEKSKREKGVLVRRNSEVEHTEHSKVVKVIRRSHSLMNFSEEKKGSEEKKIDRFSLPYYLNQDLLRSSPDYGAEFKTNIYTNKLNI